MIRSICFDLDGVYFTKESFPRFKDALSTQSPVPKEKVDEIMHGSDEMLRFKKGHITESQFWDFVRTSLQISFNNEQIFAALRDAYTVSEDVLDIVRKVRKNGFQTCVCSNNFVTRIRELNAKFDFLKEFDVTVFSYEFGIMKPDKGIFQKLVDKCGVGSEEIVYSDDSPEKLGGAKEIGIQTFVFEGVEQFTERLEGLGVL